MTIHTFAVGSPAPISKFYMVATTAALATAVAGVAAAIFSSQPFLAIGFAVSGIYVVYSVIARHRVVAELRADVANLHAALGADPDGVPQTTLQAQLNKERAERGELRAQLNEWNGSMEREREEVGVAAQAATARISELERLLRSEQTQRIQDASTIERLREELRQKGLQSTPEAVRAQASAAIIDLELKRLREENNTLKAELAKTPPSAT